ncbi:hypothetical protein GCM10017566_18040 [Amycolatopsis bartoniae]|uniref:diacylglycerol O-acyltransferase n=2 Tax=Amycolatopsis bartoniae TaxID=941986 RepID=A0A8H9ITG6_9PSEU|nr:hypothetical protein GCM10017566_18040 [Amycolatopsis bartoniae]
MTHVFLALDRFAPDPTDMYFGFRLRMGGEPPALDALRERLADRVRRLPQLTHRLVDDNGQARWERDEDFDLARHVHALPPSDAVVPARSLFPETPDHARPRWGLWLVPGTGGWFLNYVAHHAVHDAFSMVHTLDAMFGDAAPADAAPPVRRSWRGVPALVADALKTYRQPVAWPPLAAPVGQKRLLAHHTVELARLRTVAAAAGATVNQVHLAATASALNEWPAAGSPGPLHALLPVDTRLPGEPDTGSGNKIGLVRAPLFTELPTTRQRLEALKKATARQRLTRRRAGFRAFSNGSAQRLVGWALGRFTNVAHTAVGISNLRLDRQLAVFGTPVDEVVPLPWLPPGNACFSLAAGYRNHFTVSMLAHDGVADPAGFTDAWAQALDELQAEFG